MFLSIILPCHNAEKNIKDSIESVINQTCDDWELIVIDDGSTDRTPKILNTYANHERIKIISLDVNKGVSAARNLGLCEANAQYIGFLDSDDSFKVNFVEEMKETISRFNCDIVWCQYVIVSGSPKKEYFVDNNLPKNKILNNTDLLHCFYNGTKGIASLWNKIYSKDYIDREVTTRFNEERRRAGDWEFNLTLFQKNGTCVVLNECLYYYNRLVDSSITTSFPENDFNMKFRSITLLQECNKKFDLGHIEREIYTVNSHSIFEFLYYYTKSNSYKKYLEKIGSKNFRDFIKNTDISVLAPKFKLHAWLIKFRLSWVYYLASKTSFL